MRTLVSSLGFPVLLCASIGACIALIERGFAPPTVVILCVAGSYLWLALLERFLPYRHAWLEAKDDLATDGAWFLTNGAMNRFLEPPLLAGVVIVGGYVSQRYGAALWPGQSSLVVQLGLALVVAELFEYWIHRLMHETELLWRFHAVHHSAPRLYWLNAVRFHPVDYAMVGIGKLVPLALLGAGPEVFAMVNVFSAVHGAYQHANLPVGIGPLNWVFSMAELHRWHHSRAVEEANHNYGGNLILWDVVFGTRYLPTDREPPIDVGLADLPTFPAHFAGLLLSPFRWSALRAQR